MRLIAAILVVVAILIVLWTSYYTVATYYLGVSAGCSCGC